MLQILHWTYVLIYQIKKSLKSNMWRRKRERVSTDQCWWACSWRPRIELLPSSLTRYTQCTSEMNEWDSLDGLVFIKWPMLKIVHLCLVWPLDLLGSLFSLNHWKFKLGAFLSGFCRCLMMSLIFLLCWHMSKCCDREPLDLYLDRGKSRSWGSTNLKTRY